VTQTGRVVSRSRRPAVIINVKKVFFFQVWVLGRTCSVNPALIQRCIVKSDMTSDSESTNRFVAFARKKVIDTRDATRRLDI